MEEEVGYYNARPWFQLWLGRETRNWTYSLWSDAHGDYDPGIPRERLLVTLAFAYLGGFEDGDPVFIGVASGPHENPTREELFKLFRDLLTEDEFFAVETAAVPQHIRCQSAADLERLVRSGSFEDRVLALTWLKLVGYDQSAESFIPTNLDQWYEEIHDGFLAEVCVDREMLAYVRRRLSMAGTLYQANGPPPLAISGATLGQPRRGWRTITYMVPDEVVDGPDEWPVAIDPRPPE